MSAAVLTKDSLRGQKLRAARLSTAAQGQTPAPTTLSPSPIADPSGRVTRECACGAPLVKKPGPGRWPTRCADCRANTSPRANVHSIPENDPPVGAPLEQGQSARPRAIPNEIPLADPALAFAADVLDDLEKVRNANANRLRTMTMLDADSDGVVRGFGLDESHPDVARLAAMVTALDGLTADATKQLQRQMRRHPLGAWVKAQRGIGEKQAARLLAAVGDPYWNTLHNRPRTVSELWAYCGLHVLTGGDPGHVPPDTQIHPAGVAARRRKGVNSNWSTNAKTRAWLCIESCMKQIDATCKGDNGIGHHAEGCKCSPYRIAVDERRTRTAVTHPEWSAGHSLNDAMRVASKALLRDLWVEARRIHEEQQ